MSQISRRTLTLRLSDDALQLAPLAGLVRLARALGIDVERAQREGDDVYRDRLRRAVQHRERDALAGRLWLTDDGGRA